MGTYQHWRWALKPEIKSLWVDALLSGDYIQAKESLRNSKGHCCLGVLCDLHSKATKTEWVGFGVDHDLYLGCEVQLPTEVSEWAGLKSYSPLVSVQGSNHAVALAQLNDEGNSFAQIAAWINKQL